MTPERWQLDVIRAMENRMTWDEHLAWCKKRAHEYADQGDLANAVTSMMSDMEKHPEGIKRDSPSVGTLFMVAVNHIINGDAREVRRWIDGWH